MIPLQAQIDLATRELARHSARRMSLEQALKRTLLDRATSPAALLTAFASGAVLGRRSDLNSGAERGARQETHDTTRPLHRLLEHARAVANWMAVLPVIAGLWQTIGGTPIDDENPQRTDRNI